MYVCMYVRMQMYGDNYNINSLVIFRPGSQNRINAYVRAMPHAVDTESARKSCTNEFMTLCLS